MLHEGFTITPLCMNYTFTRACYGPYTKGSDAKSPRKAHSNYIPFAWVIGLTLGITG